MSGRYRLSVVIAEENAAANLPEILSAAAQESWPDVEFIVCSSTGAEDLPWAAAANLRIVKAEGRIPLLWREGILAASADCVALTTAHCIPSGDWIACLLESRLGNGAVAVGGAIAEPDQSGVLSSAIYLLRYFPYRPGGESRPVTEIAADNALYERAAIMRHRELLQSGFWEPSFHRCFRQEGLSLRFDPKLVVFHRNRYTIRQFFRQRLDHGYAFGLERASRMASGRLLAMTLLSPAIPVVFLAKVLSRTADDRSYIPTAIKTLPLLLLFASAWGLGEGKAYLVSCGRRFLGTTVNDRTGNSNDG